MQQQSTDTESQPSPRYGAYRLASAAISAIGGAVTGYWIGRLGDHTATGRTFAQRGFAIIGGAFGVLLSHYATKQHDVTLQRQKIVAHEAPAAPAAQAAQVQAQSVDYEGVVAPAQEQQRARG